MSYFTQDEFERMVDEMLGREVPCYDTLIYIAEKTLYKSVIQWCVQDPVLRGGHHEADIMQEIYVRLIKKCISGFLLRNGGLNDDPNGFKNWMFTVAINIKKDYAKKIKKIQFKESEELSDDIKDENRHKLVISENDLNRLKHSVKIVMESSSKVYIILTWFAQLIVISKLNINRIESNNVIIKTFDNMILDDMLTLLLSESEKIPWLQIEPESVIKLRSRMDVIHKDGGRMGDKKYHDFYMKKGPIYTVSDWINRMNSLIKREE